MGIVIGPIDAPTWYCMRQCNEAINYLKTLRNPVYDIEIKAEEDLLKHFKESIQRYAA